MKSNGLPAVAEPAQQSGAAYRGPERGEVLRVGQVSASEPVDAFQPSGRFLAKKNGEMLHPAKVTRRCVERYEEIALPQVRLPDPRHGAASPAHAAGADARPLLDHDRAGHVPEPASSGGVTAGLARRHHTRGRAEPLPAAR